MNEELSRKLAYKTQMPRYLAQLSELSGRIVEQSELSSIKDVDFLKLKLRNFTGKEKVSFEIQLNELKSDRFVHFLDTLVKENSKPVYVWIERTNSCGLFKLPDVRSFNHGFNANKIPEGIISFTTEDLEESLLLDFDDVNVEIELKGSKWINVRY